ncbi:MAG: hypothetical protein IT370_22045 [Deltaproteobacteria bacterium]|nr:hypothetical protein [Deltaproteobacteria bacterium]
MRRRLLVGLAITLGLTGCYRVHSLTPISPTAARASFATAHDDAFTVDGVRIGPDTTLILHHDAGRTTRVRAGALHISATGLAPPAPAPGIPWHAVERIDVRRLDGARTFLLFVASAGIIAGCAYYDCFSRVPR